MFPPRREMRRGNILAAILLAGPVIAGAIMVFALVCRFFFGPLPLPKQRPVKKSCVVWPAFCMGPYFWGLVLMYLTLKSARSGDFLAAGYQKKQKKDRRFFLSPPGNHRGGFRRPCAGHQIIGIIFYGGRALRQFVRRR